MKLSELKKIVDGNIELGHGDDVVVIATADYSVGPISNVDVKFAFSGFDWDSGLFILTSDIPIVRKENQ